MRKDLSGGYPRRGRRLLSVAMCVVCLAGMAFQGAPLIAQTLSMKSPQVTRAGKTITTLLFRPNDTVTLRWDRDVSDVRLKIGTSPGDFSFRNIRLLDGDEASFNPSLVNLPVGVYYAVVTNAQSNTLAGIQQEASTNPSVEYSAELKFALESTTVPQIVGPRGTISTRIPRFEWSAIPGVVAYALVVSSSPFTIGTDASGDATVEGINLVWAHLTTATSALYGEPAIANPLIQFNAAPLVPGRTYYYSVLNSYSKTDGAFLSTVFGSPVSFTLENRGTLANPVLSHPVGNVLISGDEDITFRWQSVQGAVSYDLALFERVTDGGSTVDTQVYSANVTGTSVVAPALETMRRGRYRWYVIANDAVGAASVSATADFRYDVEMGAFTFETTSSHDGSELLGVSVVVRSSEGGYNPPNPFINATSVTYSDSLRVGAYTFEARKDGFASVTVPVVISRNARTQVPIALDPLPSRISGTVVDGDGVAVNDATVKALGIGTQLEFETSTGFDGGFTIDLVPGTWSVQASRPGYRPSGPVTITAAQDQSVVLPQPLVLIDDNVLVSGRVVDQAGNPLAQATITAGAANQVITGSTDGNGAWSLQLSDAQWTISVQKNGYLSPTPRVLTLVAGDHLQNIDFILTQQSGSISGRVFGRPPGGASVLNPLAGALVRAVPPAGAVVTAVTDDLGRFTLNLGSGFHTISANRAGFGASDALEVGLRPNERVTDVRFTLGATTSIISGRVRDTAGLFLSGIRVSSSLGASAITSAGGSFTLPVPPGPQEIRAEGRGFLSPDPFDVAPAAGDQVSGVDLVMSRAGGVIEGRVRSARGAVASATVTASRSGRTRSVLTDEDGTFVLDVEPGTWLVQASKELFLDTKPVQRVVQSGQTTAIDLYLEPVHVSAQGFVSASGKGVAGAVVTFRDRATGSLLKALVRSGGFYSLALRAQATYDVVVEWEGFQRFEGEVTAPATGQTLYLDMVLLPAAAIVTGTLRAQDGSIPQGATVQARVEGGTSRQAIISGDGSFSVAADAGNVTLTADAPGYASGQVLLMLDAGEKRTGVIIELVPRHGTVVMHVHSGGAPVPAARVRMTGAAEHSALTGADGRVTIGSLPPGDYVAVVMGEGLITQEMELTVPAGSVLEQEVDMTLATGVLAGQVVDASTGEGISLVDVQLVGSFGERLVRSDADGSFAAQALPFGLVQVQVMRSGYVSSDPRPVVVTASTPALRLELEPATSTIEGIIRSATTNSGIAGVQVLAVGPAGSDVATTDTEGFYRLGSLAAGEWTLSARREGLRATPVLAQVGAGQTRMQHMVMHPGGVTLTGRVRDPSGQPLPLEVPLLVRTPVETHEAVTSLAGHFSLSGLHAGERVTIETVLQRPGYRDEVVTVDIPPAATAFDVGAIEVEVATGEITGSVGIQGAGVTARLGSRTVASAESGSGGAFSMTDLPGGTLAVEPVLAGVTFSPAQQEVVVSAGSRTTVSFTAQTRFAQVELHAATTTGAGLSGVPIEIASLDRSFVRVLTTGSSGSVSLADVPRGSTYRVQPTSLVDVFDPPFATIDLTSQSQASVVFTRIQATSFIRGTVRDDAGLVVTGADVTAISSGGQRTEVISDASGYRIGPLPAGTYTVQAERSGFLAAELEVVLDEGQEVTGADLVLVRRSATIRGRVLRAGAAVADVMVQLSGHAAAQTRTSVDGGFTFFNVDVRSDAPTVYEVRVVPVGGKPLSRTLILSEADVGTTLDLGDFLLPSSSIRLSFSDGGEPLGGMQVLITGADGTELHGATDAAGVYASPQTLSSGEYRYFLLETAVLSPTSSARTLTINSDAEVLERYIELPFSHVPVLLVAAETPVPVTVSSTGLSDAQVRLHWRLAGESTFTTRTMTRDGNTATGSIPAPGTGLFSYFVDVLDAGGQVLFASETFSIQPRVSGRLETLLVSPSLSGARIRTGESIPVRLSLRDGLGMDVSDRILSGAGSVTWTASGEGIQITPDASTAGLTALLRADVDAQGSVTVRVSMQGVDRTEVFSFSSISSPVENLVMNVTRSRLRNVADSVPLGVTGIATDGSAILLGGGVNWAVDPAGAAAVSENGLLRITNPAFIGPFTVRATDARSGKSSSAAFSAFVQVAMSTEGTFTDLAGARIDLRAGSFPFPGELSLSHPHSPPAKRFLSSDGGATAEVTAGEQVVRFELRSDRSLSGDSLSATAALRLDRDESLQLYQGARAIARFDPITLSWHALESQADGAGVSTTAMAQLGEYVTVVTNDPLGIRHAAALPTPFSPLIAPVKIGYFLDTPAPPASVSIRIFNVRGELVRRLIENDLQWSGRYGGRSSLREIEWDGLTDDGKLARNGRYVIRIEAQDRTGSVTRQLPVVLVK